MLRERSKNEYPTGTLGYSYRLEEMLVSVLAILMSGFPAIRIFHG